MPKRYNMSLNHIIKNQLAEIGAFSHFFHVRRQVRNKKIEKT